MVLSNGESHEESFGPIRGVWFVRDHTYLKKIKNKKIAVILCLTHDLSVLEKLNFASLFLEIQDPPTVRLSWFLDQFISTFTAENHSVKFQDLKISKYRKLSLQTILRRTVCRSGAAARQNASLPPPPVLVLTLDDAHASD